MIERIFGKVDFGAVFQGLREVIADPASNLVLAVMLLSLVSLVLLILVVIVLFFFVGHQDEEEDEEEPLDADDEAGYVESDEAVAESPAPEESEEQRRRRAVARRAAAVISATAIPVLLIASVVSGYVVTAQDSYCLRCHPGMQGKVESTQADYAEPVEQVHGYVRCVACHEGRQSTAFIGNIVDRSRHVVAFVAGNREPKFAVVPSHRCEDCHEEAVHGLVKDEDRGIKVSHAEPLSAGLQCRECHPDAGHVPEEQGDGMSVCVRCHDGKVAAAECSTCHFKDTAFAGSDERMFTAQRLVGKGDCGGCHDQTSCDACHGIRMPHSKDFLEGAHARLAGFEKKNSCYKCHLEDKDCSKCHSVNTAGIWGHPQNWKSIHMNVGPGQVAGCGCHGRSPYVQAGQDYCLACHPPGIR